MPEASLKNDSGLGLGELVETMICYHILLHEAMQVTLHIEVGVLLKASNSPRSLNIPSKLCDPLLDPGEPGVMPSLQQRAHPKRFILGY